MAANFDDSPTSFYIEFFDGAKISFNANEFEFEALLSSADVTYADTFLDVEIDLNASENRDISEPG